MCGSFIHTQHAAVPHTQPSVRSYSLSGAPQLFLRLNDRFTASSPTGPQGTGDRCSSSPEQQRGARPSAPRGFSRRLRLTPVEEPNVGRSRYSRHGVLGPPRGPTSRHGTRGKLPFPFPQLRGQLPFPRPGDPRPIPWITPSHPIPRTHNQRSATPRALTKAGVAQSIVGAVRRRRLVGAVRQSAPVLPASSASSCSSSSPSSSSSSDPSSSATLPSLSLLARSLASSPSSHGYSARSF